MELRLLATSGEVLHIQVMGRISRVGWSGPGDPLADLAGVGIYDRTVLFNLSEAQAIDSTGIEWLLICHRRFSERGGLLIIHSSSLVVQQMLKLTRLDLVLHVAGDEIEARQLIETRRAAGAVNGDLAARRANGEDTAQQQPANSHAH